MTEQLVSRMVIADHELPAELRVGHVEVRRITMGPDVKAGPHEHNGPVFGLILSGAAEFQIGDGPIAMLGAGDVFYEPGHERIARFDAQNEGVEFMAWFPMPAAEAPTLTGLD